MLKLRFLCTVIALVVLAPSQDYAQRASTARIRPLPAAQWTDADREALGPMGARGDETIDVFKTCLRHTELCRNWMVFTRYILSAASTLPPRDKEMLILRASALSHADYDWGHHVPAGKRAGLTDEDLVRIVRGPDAPGWNDFDRALLRAADELHGDQYITDATWAALATRYSEKQMMDAIFTVGQYTMVSMFLNSANVQLEAGVPRIPR